MSSPATVTPGSNRRYVVGILGCHLLLQALLLVIYYVPETRPLTGDEGHYLQVAEHLITEGSLGLEPLWPQLYPTLLSRLLQWTDHVVPWVQLAQSALLLAVGWCVFVLGVAFGLGRRAALFAAALVLCTPSLVAFSHSLWSESLHLALLVGIVLLVVRASTRAWEAVLLGVLLGAVFLTKYLLLPFSPLLLLAYWMASRSVRQLVLVLLTAGVVFSTFSWSAHRRGDQVVLLGSGEFNLALGLGVVETDTNRQVWRAYQDYLAGGDDFDSRRRAQRSKVIEYVRETPKLELLVRQLSRQPKRLLDWKNYHLQQMTGGKLHRPDLGYVPRPPWSRLAVEVWTAGVYGFVLLLSPLGLLVLWRERPKSWWLVTSFLAYHAALFAVLHATTRYRVPLLPFLAILAALGFREVVRAWPDRLRGMLMPSKVAAILCGGLAVGIAFW